jgi:hypothetical protein
VKAIQTKECPRVYWGSVVRNCIDLLDTLPNTSVIWGKRDGYKVAHQLARWAFKTPIRGWLTTPPPPHCISYPYCYGFWLFVQFIVPFIQKKKKIRLFSYPFFL